MGKKPLVICVAIIFILIIFSNILYSKYFMLWKIPNNIVRRENGLLSGSVAKEEKPIRVDVLEKDIDVNGKLLKIRLKSVPGKTKDFIKLADIQIYEKADSDYIQLFSLNETGDKIFGEIVYSEFTNILERIHFNNKDDGNLELFIDYTDFSYEPPCQYRIIIGKIDGNYKVVLHDAISNIEFIDVDKDGVKELVGMSSIRDSVSYDFGFRKVYKFIDNKYYPSYQLTKDLISDEVIVKENEFKNNPSELTLGRLVFMYAYMGMKEKCDGIISKNKHMIKNNNYDPQFNHQNRSILNGYENMAELYSRRWQKLKEDDKN